MGKQCIRRIESFTRGTHITRIKSDMLLQMQLPQNMNINSNVIEIGMRKEAEKTEVNNTVFVQGIPDIASAQMIAEYFSERLKFPSLWRPSQVLDKSIIEAAEKLSISRKEFVCDLLIEWPKSKVLESFQCFGKLEMSWFSGIVERPSNNPSGESLPVVLKPWIMTEGVCLDDHVCLVRR
ncbi:hypothetical protein T09_13631 [Trichinella sp. T9]|nr:hypothetical protein T09_13631 [Trichinella sp. T9]